MTNQDNQALQQAAEAISAPELLGTVYDCENAPEGTVVESPTRFQWVKRDGSWFSETFMLTSKEMAYRGRCRVLSWGEK